MILLKGLLQSRNIGRNVNHVPAGAVSFQDEVVIFIIPGFHSFKGVSVIGVFESQRHGSLSFAPIHVILQGHFQGYLHAS